MAPKVRPAEERIWQYVDKEGPISSLGTQCWMWTGAKTTYSHSGGVQYGRFRGPNSKMVPPHRFMYEMMHGPVTAQAMDHLCRNTLCVNPKHLEPVSDRENIMRGHAPTAFNNRKTQCPQGHDYDRQYKDGRRYCFACRKAQLAKNQRDRKTKLKDQVTKQ